MAPAAPPQATYSGVCELEVERVHGLAAGTGFLVDATGLIVTNAHVVEDGLAGAARFAGTATRVPVELVTIDQRLDLALLRCRSEVPKDALPLQVAKTLPGLGSDVWAVGFPRLGLTVTKGIVSGVRKHAFLPTEIQSSEISEDSQWIQTDCVINPGNSGGPLLDNAGKVVGVNTWRIGYDPNRNYDGAYFSLSQIDLLEFLLRPHGTDVGWPGLLASTSLIPNGKTVALDELPVTIGSFGKNANDWLEYFRSISDLQSPIFELTIADPDGYRTEVQPDGTEIIFSLNLQCVHARVVRSSGDPKTDDAIGKALRNSFVPSKAIIPLDELLENDMYKRVVTIPIAELTNPRSLFDYTENFGRWLSVSGQDLEFGRAHPTLGRFSREFKIDNNSHIPIDIRVSSITSLTKADPLDIGSKLPSQVEAGESKSIVLSIDETAISQRQSGQIYLEAFDRETGGFLSSFTIRWKTAPPLPARADEIEFGKISPNRSHSRICKVTNLGSKAMEILVTRGPIQIAPGSIIPGNTTSEFLVTISPSRESGAGVIEISFIGYPDPLQVVYTWGLADKEVGSAGKSGLNPIVAYPVMLKMDTIRGEMPYSDANVHIKTQAPRIPIRDWLRLKISSDLIVEVSFDTHGSPDSHRVVQGSGENAFDIRMIDAFYRYRASGPLIDNSGTGESRVIQFTVPFPAAE